MASFWAIPYLYYWTTMDNGVNYLYVKCYKWVKLFSRNATFFRLLGGFRCPSIFWYL